MNISLFLICVGAAVAYACGSVLYQIVRHGYVDTEEIIGVFFHQAVLIFILISTGVLGNG